MNKRILLRIVTVATFLCVILVYICSCSSMDMNEYYLEKENYVNVHGTITNITYNDDSSVLYLEFSDLSPVLDDVCFKIVGENLEIVQKNGIENKVNIGNQISFVTAPRYFGDGYVMPIVAMSANGETLLDFEDGYVNWLNWLDEQ